MSQPGRLTRISKSSSPHPRLRTRSASLALAALATPHRPARPTVYPLTIPAHPFPAKDVSCRANTVASPASTVTSPANTVDSPPKDIIAPAEAISSLATRIAPPPKDLVSLPDVTQRLVDAAADLKEASATFDLYAKRDVVTYTLSAFAGTMRARALEAESALRRSQRAARTAAATHLAVTNAAAATHLAAVTGNRRKLLNCRNAAASAAARHVEAMKAKTEENERISRELVQLRRIVRLL